MMKTDLVISEMFGSLHYKELVENASYYAQSIIAQKTKKTYEDGWKSFTDWCCKQNVDPLLIKEKEALVAIYAADKAKSGQKIGGLETFIAGINHTYKSHGFELDMRQLPIAKVFKGIRRRLTSKTDQKEPILPEDLKEMIKAIPLEGNEKVRRVGLRNRALILVGFFGAFRRSELVGIKYEDLRFCKDGVIVFLAKSKTDQEGIGMEKILPYGNLALTCPVLALKAWLEESKITSGYIFSKIDASGFISYRPLEDHTVARIIKTNPYIRTLDQRKYAGHSLRAGFVTSAVKQKIGQDLIMQQTGHKDISSLQCYIRRGRNIEESAAAQLRI